MSNIDTVSAITENIRAALRGLGLELSAKTYDDEKNIPASLLPLGTVLYEGESFEYTHGQRPGYAEARFLVKVILGGVAEDTQQKWVHRVRESLTVDALNTGSLLDAKNVTKVTVKEVTVTNGPSLSSITSRVHVRYREK